MSSKKKKNKKAKPGGGGGGASGGLLPPKPFLWGQSMKHGEAFDAMLRDDPVILSAARDSPGTTDHVRFALWLRDEACVARESFRDEMQEVARFSERCDAEAARRGTGDDPAERMKLYADVMGWELTFPPVPAGKVAMHLIPTERLVSTHVEGRHFSREMLPQVRRGAAPGRRTRMISRSRGRARRPTH